jgi:hypothetical protein
VKVTLRERKMEEHIRNALMVNKTSPYDEEYQGK